jgi:hypothetical protein
MRPVTQVPRDEHRQLLEQVERIRVIARELPWVSWGERRETVDHALRFLNESVIPHLEAEERVPYPDGNRAVGQADAASAFHDAIRARIERLADADLADTERIQELLYGLHALISVDAGGAAREIRGIH